VTSSLPGSSSTIVFMSAFCQQAAGETSQIIEPPLSAFALRMDRFDRRVVQ